MSSNQTAVVSKTPLPESQIQPFALEITARERHKLVSEKIAAEHLDLSVRTLQAWRMRGGGPVYISISRKCVKHRIYDLDSWVSDRIKTSTSEQGR